MMSARQRRRTLDRRRDAALEIARGSVVAVDPTSIVLVREDGEAQAVPGALAASVLRSLGLSKLHLEIEGERAKRPSWIPTVIVIDGMAQFLWTEALHLSKGGDA